MPSLIAHTRLVFMRRGKTKNKCGREQEGLKAQQSRMDVDLPFAARLGVETTDSDKNKKVRLRMYVVASAADSKLVG